MNRNLYFCIIIITVICTNTSFAQSEYWQPRMQSRVLSMGAYIQSWSIDGEENPISEGTFPFSAYWPVSAKMNVQLLHSPAVSRFGELKLNGLSDTWLLGNYAFVEDKYVVSAGIGLPTGKTVLTNEETILSSILGSNVFHFRLPVFGQGFTLSSGFSSAFQINEKLVLGAGLNLVVRSPFKFSDEFENVKFNPGNQTRINIGLDYQVLDNFRTSVDLLYTYYSKDKIDNVEVFGAAAKLGAKIAIQYVFNKSFIWAIARYRASGKNETWNGVTLVSEPLNSNITEREIEAIYQFKFSEIFSINALFDARSYVENEFGIGQADIFGGGVGNEIQLLDNLKLYTSFKLFSGDGYFKTGVLAFSGIEFSIKTSLTF